MAEHAGREEKTEQNAQGGYKESNFILLDDLVYAPLHALAKSNQLLREQVVDAIKDMGTLRRDGKEETICLKNMNISYEQLHPEGDEGYSVDNLQLQVPLLSIIPMTNLNVEKAEIEFSAEIKAEEGEEGKGKIMARICSPSQREGDFLPRVSYRMKIASLPATEGVMRLTDLFSANQIAKKMDSTPVAVDGNLGSERQKNIRQEISMLKGKIKKLKQLYQKISDMTAEQERLFELSEESFAEDTFEFDKDKYLMAQSHITNRIMEYQEQIMSREVEAGLEQDYE